jgi:hypothetical protein
MNFSGQIMKTIDFKSGENQFDISDLESGSYILIITADGKQSNAMKFILQK